MSQTLHIPIQQSSPERKSSKQNRVANGEAENDTDMEMAVDDQGGTLNGQRP